MSVAISLRVRHAQRVQFQAGTLSRLSAIMDGVEGHGLDELLSFRQTNVAASWHRVWEVIEYRTLVRGPSAGPKGTSRVVHRTR